MYVTGNSNVVFDNITIAASTSFYDGGLIYAVDTSGSDKISITFSGTTTISNMVS